ncbi:hypothetical protein M440DRAFT_1402803 [Trichoderma longibrachiatum ATCC 18648]|uniref:Uncharacterized protein n=1 Tax=Trichoderma longibrachiatum ATCC 18648 TaxID=983965 RepID=A0A2T4C129_TRILO|nr:hypothetical protein M440DRAFT_1402803 [Trichoderma longibrachiatum ATCC 18648]
MSSTTSCVSEGDFSFANGVFFAESSGRNRHRRATHEELRAHFASGHERDYAAHWFEAQLMHYGLRPSKVKPVARMRLFDAIRGGSLSVPFHIAELEQKLKKEWTKRDRAEKNAEKAAVSREAEASIVRKRKSEVTVNITVNAGSPAATASVPKRIKTSESSADDSAPAPRFAMKQTARRGSGWRAPSRPEPARRASPPPGSPPSSAPRPIYTARRGGAWRGPSRPETARRPSPSPAQYPDSFPASYPAPGTKHMARRGGSFASGGRAVSSQTETGEYSDSASSFDEAPPPYEEFSDPNDRFDGPSLSPLGLLNGRYDISSPHVETEWPMYGSDFSLVLTIVGSSLWGRFDLGVIEGVLYIEQRPRASSYQNISFVWRGREAEGPISYDERANRGSLRFLGDGRIEGHFEYQDISFEGQRLPGQGTRSELDARTLQNEWDNYNEDEYEYENRARWR